jgi:hypothetical protein
MNTNKNRSNFRWVKSISVAVLTGTLVLGVAGCGHMMMLGHGAEPPSESEFGLGPRTSAQGLYTATLEPSRPLRPRQMDKVRVLIEDARGEPIDGATIQIDGGMPQHGHGLPTQPRVTKQMGEGVYEIEGVRFNMGGWWEFKLEIAGAPGTDRVTFNLAL